MNQDKLNVLAMHERVLDFLETHTAIWQPFEPVAEQVAILRSSIITRRTALVGQQVRSEGMTAAKGNAHLAAIDAVLRIACFANSYALAKHDTDLYAQTTRSRTYLRELPDDQSLAVLNQMLTTIDAKLAVLKPYGITKADLSSARDTVAHAQALRNAPRSVIDARKTAGSELGAQERVGRQALKVMDKAIHFFNSINAMFVAGYRNARIIVTEGVRHTGTDDTAHDAANTSVG